MIDALLMFDGAQSAAGVFAGAALTVTRVSTNVLDLLVARDIGIDDMVELHVGVAVAFTAGGAATLTVTLQYSADNATFVDVISTAAVPVANLTAGQQLFRVAMPLNQPGSFGGTPPRYLRLNYTVATGPMTAGTIYAYLTGMRDRNAAPVYPKNYTVSN